MLVKSYDDCGSFTLNFEYTKQELQDKGEAMAEYVQKLFDREFDSYKKMIAKLAGSGRMKLPHKHSKGDSKLCPRKLYS